MHYYIIYALSHRPCPPFPDFKRSSVPATALNAVRDSGTRAIFSQSYYDAEFDLFHVHIRWFLRLQLGHLYTRLWRFIIIIIIIFPRRTRQFFPLN
jgi:hypothetical protein